MFKVKRTVAFVGLIRALIETVAALFVRDTVYAVKVGHAMEFRPLITRLFWWRIAILQMVEIAQRFDILRFRCRVECEFVIVCFIGY